jgi:hypothetical protein
MKNNFDIKKFIIKNKITRNSKIVKENFELDDDWNVDSSFDGSQQYNLALEIAKSYEDDEILQDFLSTFPVNKFISKQDFGDFFSQYIEDISDWFYINQNWKYVESGGDESVFDEDEDDEDEDDEDLLESNDEDDSDEDDWNVDSSFVQFPITIELHNEYHFFNDETEEHDYLVEIKKLETNSKQLEQVLGKPIPNNENDLEELLFDEYIVNYDLFKFLNSGVVISPIPEEYYSEGWDNYGEDIKIKVILNNNLNESDEDDDWNVDSSFKHELKVGDYFYGNSTSEEYNGVWTKLENVPSYIQNYVKKIIYIGPNKGKYENPNYYDDDIIVYEFANNPVNFYDFTVDFFNEQYSDLINAYIPTDLNESENDEDDWNVDSSFTVKYLTVGDTIKGSMWNWQAIVDYIEEAWNNHPDIANTEIDNWKDFYDNGVEIIEISDDFEYLPGYFVTLNSGENTDYENHTYSVEFIEKLLNPKYKIELPLFEYL